MKVRSKFWFDKDGDLVFGEGRFNLLKAIAETGSISQAAKKLSMSYKRAWSYLTVIEERLNIKFIEKQRGGVDGGNSILTKEGKLFLEQYEQFRKGLNQYIDEKFNKIFKGK